MRKVFGLIFVLCLSIIMVSCTNAEIETTIINGGFEEGSTDEWVGWTRSGNAFSVRGVSDSSTSFEIDVDKSGTYWFSGLDGGTQKMTGELTSNTFKLTGTGHIAFKMGAARTENIHVDFYVEGEEVPVASITNTDFNEPYITVQMIRKIVDLSEYLDKNMYIQVVDNDDEENFGYVNLDDFLIVKDDVQLTSLTAERNAQLEKYSEPEFEEDPTSTTIVNGSFETGDLTGWKILSGSAFTNAAIISTNQLFWESAHVYGHGDYYLDGSNNGLIPESNVGAIRSTKFTLAGDGWITFMIGAAPSRAYVTINDGETDEVLLTIDNPTFSDPNLPLTLRRVYVDASEYIGEVLYISIVDENNGSGFAFITADDFRVSLTEQNVKDLMIAQYNDIMSETRDSSYGHLANIQKYYREYDYPFELPVFMFTKTIPNKIVEQTSSIDLTTYLNEAEAKFGSIVADVEITKVVYNEVAVEEGFDTFDLSAAGNYEVHYKATLNEEILEEIFIIQTKLENNLNNGDFEMGDTTGWEVIEGTIDTSSSVISAQTFWGEEISYNKGGTYHFDGWSSGAAEPEGYKLKSTTFELSGSGWASFKLGGHAAFVQVFTSDDTLIAEFRNEHFADVDFPYLGGGGRLATMTTYFADLSEYLGEDIYVVIGDDANVSGWAVAFIDEVNFYYESVPTLTYDEVTESGDKSDETVQIDHELAVNVA